MGTRAVITFIDGHNSWHIYQQWDGDPDTVLANIERAKALAWSLPRFEADEFAAAYVAATKHGEGNIRLTHHYNDHGDLAYRFEVRAGTNGILDVRAFGVDYGNDFEWKPYIKEKSHELQT